jgi:hypothetical protein
MERRRFTEILGPLIERSLLWDRSSVVSHRVLSIPTLTFFNYGGGSKAVSVSLDSVTDFRHISNTSKRIPNFANRVVVHFSASHRILNCFEPS